MFYVGVFVVHENKSVLCVAINLQTILLLRCHNNSDNHFFFKLELIDRICFTKRLREFNLNCVDIALQVFHKST